PGRACPPFLVDGTPCGTGRAGQSPRLQRSSLASDPGAGTAGKRLVECLGTCAGCSPHSPGPDSHALLGLSRARVPGLPLVSAGFIRLRRHSDIIMTPSRLTGYAELDCISNFSFLTGASHPEELVQRAARLGYQALALSDECSLAGVVRAHQEALRHEFHFIVGTRFRVEEGMELIALACNLNGYGNISETITLA